MAREITYAQALVEGLRAELAADERVHLLGQYFLGITKHRGLMAELHHEFPDRVWYPPIAEAGYIGTGIGAAMVGLRPIIDVATASFIFQGWAQVANEAANIHYMSGGQTRVPAVFHVNHGIRGGGAAQHSHSPQAMLWNTPGLEIVTPSSPYEVKGLIRSAVASPNPTMWIDHVGLFDLVEDVPEEAYAIPFGRARVARAGADVTIVATSLMVSRSLAAAERLAREGIDVEVIDPRTLVPLDEGAILESVAKTGRVVVVDECHRRCGVGAELAALIAEQAFGDLRAPIRRVVTEDVPVPFSAPLEERIAPTEQKIVAAVAGLVGEEAVR
ncbi:MAG: alpha-ketoacid dehydrogenase subunit beta [Thermoleophilia bacterium]|nr:alpha-ketoacid dehydrogenase subunit beta [Thermoleophilia bacterium]